MDRDFEEKLKKLKEMFEEAATKAKENRRQSYYGAFDFGFDTAFGPDPIIEQCKKDAVEYFNSAFGTRLMDEKAFRVTGLSSEEKKRVLEFLKSRKEHYHKEGLIL